MADKRITELPVMAKGAVDGSDIMITYDVQSNRTQQMTVGSLLANARADSHGYYALLTNFYFTGGVATTTEVALEDTDDWIDVDFTTDALGTFDKRPTAMIEAIATPFDETTREFSLEGLTVNSSVSFRASMSFEPDEDEGEVQARLIFTRHSGTIPNTQFPIEDIALTMTQGADVNYPAEPFLSFFVGDTIDTNGVGDAGVCKFQIKSTVPGTLSMRALTWFINQ